MRLPGVRGPLSSVTRSTCLPPRCSWFWPETLVANAVPRVVTLRSAYRATAVRRSPAWRCGLAAAANRVGDAARRTAPDRPSGGGERLGGPGSVQGLPERAYASTSPRWQRPTGKSESLLQDQRRGRRPASGGSRLVVPSVVAAGVPDLIGTLPAPLDMVANMLAIRPTARQCDAARPFCRWTPSRMAGFVGPARRQRPCKEQLRFYGISSRSRWPCYAGIAVLAVVALAVLHRRAAPARGRPPD
jgi:hypothetical protein